MVRSSYTEAAWVSYATRCRCSADPAGSPSTVTVPLSTFCTPTIERMSVVLPHPLGPSRPVTCPRGMSSWRPSNTTFGAALHAQTPHLDGVPGAVSRGTSDDLFITR